MNQFLSCDWGTSSFRLRLVDRTDQKIILEEKSDCGIASTYALWKNSVQHGEDSRFLFYYKVIHQHIYSLEQKLNRTLSEVPLVISGMASSSIGMKEMPYKRLPFATSGVDLGFECIDAYLSIPHPILLISGIKSETDVMRGEETQLLGLTGREASAPDQQKQVFVFPGTHSKHIIVSQGKVEDFSTYMTGEFFELLTKKSILQASVSVSNFTETDHLLLKFKQGVKEGAATNLLHAVFMVRTRHLFAQGTKEENFSYLSGLLIGAELKELLHLQASGIFLCSGGHLKSAYASALEVLQLKAHIFSDSDMDKAVARGQTMILQQLTPKQ